MPSQFENFAHPDQAVSVTPNDSSNLVNNGVLYVGGAGDVALITAGGDDVVFSNVSGGTFLPILCARVKATGTTASNILVIY